MIKVDREYVEIYPLNWHPLSEESVHDIFAGQSHPLLRSLCVYVHIPFCTVICPFCAFNKRMYRADLYEHYVNSLIKELRFYQDHLDSANRSIQSIYFGGGTGSVLWPKHVRLILDEIRSIFKISSSAQITMECYPTTLNKYKLNEYLRAGINRISIGLQTFDESFLNKNNRGDSIGTFSEVCKATRDVGFDNLRLDIMYRLPGQTMDDLRQDLDKFIELEPDGISTYSLEVEGLSSERLFSSLPDDDIDREMFYFIGEYLSRQGYERFAQPDFSIPGREDQYVLNAWAAPQGLLLGLGAGAQTHQFGGHIYANICSIERYISEVESGHFPGVVGAKLDTEELQHKYLVLGVRCLRISKSKFHSLFQKDIDAVFKEELDIAVDRGWLSNNGDEYLVTSDGLWYIDNLSKLFYSNSNMPEFQPRGKNLIQYNDRTLVKI